MVRWVKKLAVKLFIVCMLAAFAYCVLLPHILPREYSEYVEKYAAEYQLEESLVYAVIFCESHFQPDAVSPAGAVGLMQVTEETGLWAAGQVGLETPDLRDPETNIRLGCWYLKWLEEKFSGIQETGLAAYNAGHGNVAKWLADEEKSRDGLNLDEIPFGETKSYVKRVQLAELLYRILYRF